VDGETARFCACAGLRPVDDAGRRRVLYGTLIECTTRFRSPGATARSLGTLAHVADGFAGR
jgi:hypothetical protein